MKNTTARLVFGYKIILLMYEVDVYNDRRAVREKIRRDHWGIKEVNYSSRESLNIDPIDRKFVELVPHES